MLRLSEPFLVDVLLIDLRRQVKAASLDMVLLFELSKRQILSLCDDGLEVRLTRLNGVHGRVFGQSDEQLVPHIPVVAVECRYKIDELPELIQSEVAFDAHFELLLDSLEGWRLAFMLQEEKDRIELTLKQHNRAAFLGCGDTSLFKGRLLNLPVIKLLLCLLNLPHQFFFLILKTHLLLSLLGLFAFTFLPGAFFGQHLLLFELSLTKATLMKDSLFSKALCLSFLTLTGLFLLNAGKFSKFFASSLLFLLARELSLSFLFHLATILFSF